MFRVASLSGSTLPRESSFRRAVSSMSLSKRRAISVFLLRVWLAFLSAILLGYALFGRGFAYVGIGKAYLGEICLLTGFVWLATYQRWNLLLRSKVVIGILVLQVWGVICTLPYLDNYGINALREAVLWGYSWYAIIVAAAIVAAPRTLETIIRRYRFFAIVFLSCIPVVWCASNLFPSQIPVWAGSDVPMIGIRSSEMLVHLSGVFCFFACGLGGSFGLLRAVLLVGSLGMAGSVSRGGLLAFLASCSLGSVMGQSKGVLVRCLVVTLTIASVMIMTSVAVPMSYDGRLVSAGQLVTNLLSTVTRTEDTGWLEDTKDWRLNWWKEIDSYVVHGPYFFTGKGYGVDLADSDGFKVSPDDSNRNPHNSHLTFLARSGVPGFIIWVAFLCSWFAQMTLSYVRARRLRLRMWAGLFLFVICYALAMIVNAMFATALESPILGIWFWSLVGLGIGASLVSPRRLARSELRNEAPSTPNSVE